MSKLIVSLALVGALMVFGKGVAANDNITLEDLKPQFETSKGPDYSKPAPKIETDYDRFEKRVRERSEADGFGLDYDASNKAPMIIYKDSFE